MADALSLLDTLVTETIEALRLGRSLLVQAAATGQHETLRFLLGRLFSRDVTACPETQQLKSALLEAFEAAAENGHAECLALMLDLSPPQLVDWMLAPDEQEEDTAAGAGGDEGHDRFEEWPSETQAAAPAPASPYSCRPRGGGNALILAVKAGHERCMALLLQQRSPGAQAAATDGAGMNALLHAMSHVRPDWMALLLNHNPEAQVAARFRGKNALMLAAVAGLADCLKLLLQYSPDSQVECTDDDDCNALMLAAQGGHADCVALLLRHSPEQQLTHRTSCDTGGGMTALMVAAADGHAAVVSLLLQHATASVLDSVLCETNYDGFTALALAVQGGHEPCVQLLLQHSPEKQVAEGTHVYDHADGAQVYGAGDDVYVCGDDDDTYSFDAQAWTPLMSAVREGQVGCTRLLLQHCPSAQVAAATTRGFTPLMVAASNGRVDCMHLLLQHSPGVQVGAADRRGRTALMWAARRGQVGCLALLLQHSPEAQLMAAAQRGETALMLAAEEGHAACAAALLDHAQAALAPAQMAKADRRGRCALVAAAEHEDAACLKVLLAHDAPQHHLDSALLPALRSSHAACLDLLVARGAYLPFHANEADRVRHRQLLQDLACRALAADRINEATVGLALAARGEKRKLGC